MQSELSNHQLQDAIAFTGHEWRNQVARLYLSVEKLLQGFDGPLTAQQTSTVQHIRQSAILMNRIATNYLNLARLGGPAFMVRASFVDPVRDMIEPLLYSYADLLAERRQTYEIEVCKPHMLIWADRGLLMSVLENLINNAIKYGEDEGKMVISVVERGTKDEISVWNSGHGIAPDYYEHVFERFDTGEIVGDPQRSTGIGLYLARKIVEAHDGNLWVESQPGAWVKFIMTLPKRELG